MIVTKTGRVTHNLFIVVIHIHRTSVRRQSNTTHFLLVRKVIVVCQEERIQCHSQASHEIRIRYKKSDYCVGIKHILSFMKKMYMIRTA